MVHKRLLTLLGVLLLCITQSGTLHAQKKKKGGGGDGAQAHAEKAIELAQKGAYEEAITECTLAIEASSKEFWLYNNRGKLLTTVKRYPEANADYTKAIELAPKEDYVAYSERGGALTAQNQLEPALADLNKALELKPNDPMTLERRALIYQKQKNFPAALADLDNALSQEANNVIRLNRRADIYAANNEWAKAIPDLEAVLAAKPDDFTAQERLDFVRAKAAPPTPPPAPTATPIPKPTPKPPLVTRTNVFISIGALLLLGVVAVIIAKMMMTRSDA